MLGRLARIPVDVLYGTSLLDIQSVDNYVAQQSRILEDAYKRVCCVMDLKQDRQKELYCMIESDMVNHFSAGILQCFIPLLYLKDILKGCTVHGTVHKRMLWYRSGHVAVLWKPIQQSKSVAIADNRELPVRVTKASITCCQQRNW